MNKRTCYKWAVSVRFMNNKEGSAEETREKYEEFKKRMIQSIPSCKDINFTDKHFIFYKILNKPSDVFDYFYALNPLPGDTILDDAAIKIERVLTTDNGAYYESNPRKKHGRYPWGDKKKATNKTDPIVEGGAKND